MFTLRPITSFEVPELTPYRTLRAQIDHANRGIFVAEGEKVVRRLLLSRHEVVSVLLPPNWVSEFEPLLLARPEAIDLFVADKEVLMQLSGFSMYQGVLAVGRVPRALTWDELVGLPSPRLLAAVDGLTNAENVGAVVRNAVALGVQALVVGEKSSHPYLRRSVRSSMGGVFKLPYYLSDQLLATLRQLTAEGIRTIAAHPRPESRVIWEADLTGDSCLVLGAEGDGIRSEIVEACSETAMIPMELAIDSLNVASAAAVCFAEAQRQRCIAARSLRPDARSE